MKPFFYLLLSTTLALSQNDPDSTTSNNNEIQVLPAPGPVTIDGKDGDWDLTAGIWSYNDPTIVGKNSVWTHLMWDEKGIYLLGRYSDPSPMKNATRGKDFMLSWKADAFQARLIFDDKTPDEHQMHMNLFYSSAENAPYMIVKHGGFKAKPPYDSTGPDRPDQQEKYGTTMDAFGGRIAFSPWEDGQGYNMEAFWPWSYLRSKGQPMKAGESFVFGLEAMWGSDDGTEMTHRLADNLKDDKVNRIFFFRARDGWGKATLAGKGKSNISATQKALHATRLKQFVNFDTQGPVDIKYNLPDDRDVTIAIDNSQGQRVRNLIGQFPRTKGDNIDHWDGLDDHGNPLPAGDYKISVVDHLPVKVKFVNSVYNAATPPWATKTGRKFWGSNHGYPTTAATRGDVTLIGFTGTEGGSGLIRITPDGIIQWADGYELLDVTLDDKYAYTFARDSWIKQVVMRRLDINTGALVTFNDEAKSPNAILPAETQDVPDSSTIALSKGKIFIFIPGGSFHRMNSDTGAVEASYPMSHLIAIEDHNDELYGLFDDGGIARLDADGKRTATLFIAKNLKKPVRFTISQDSSTFAISDQESNQVHLFDAKGNPVRGIGKPYTAIDGKRAAGKFIDTDLIDPLGLAYDAKGRLWLAEAEGSNRRITCWLPDGKLDHQFWGGADYGAMSGFPLTYDSSRFIAHGVEFKLDPQPDIFNRPTRETPLFFHPELSKTRGLVYQYQGHEYAVSVPGFNKPGDVIIAKRGDDGVFKTVVRMTYDKSSSKPPVPGKTWTDLNDNGTEDPGETTGGFTGRSHYWSNGWMRPDLVLITPDQYIYRPREFTKSGVPVYDFDQPEKLPNTFKADFSPNRSGTIAFDNAGNISDGINFATVDGRSGTYPNPYGRHDAPAAQRGLLIAPFRTNGVVENVPGVGSITAIGGDRGEWFLMTMDGLYLSSILQDSKGDVTLDESYVGQESFGGFMWRDEKGRVLAQLGGASYRIVEITGLESTRKQIIPVKLSTGQIAAGMKLAQSKLANVEKEPETLSIPSLARLPGEPVSPDASRKQALIEGVETIRVQESGDPTRWFRTALAHDARTLAVMFQVSDSSPWKNAEGRFTHAFIGGDSVDLQLDIPGRGPIRILGASIGGKDSVVYWQKTSDKKDNPSTYVVSTNEANAQNFDIVRRLASAKISVTPGMRGYSVLLKIPLAELGLDATRPIDLKGIIGVIFSDPSGSNRASRLYWHDKSTGLVSDVPSEARLSPANWGPVRFQN